jgi:hypothetical protein
MRCMPLCNTALFDGKSLYIGSWVPGPLDGTIPAPRRAHDGAKAHGHYLAASIPYYLEEADMSIH